MNYQALSKLLFLLPAEFSHHLALQSMHWLQYLNLSALLRPERVHDPVTVMGITFPNRVGLAAGLDKNARAIDGLGAMGFGFLEVGTVTPRPQRGNPKPRLFRLGARDAIINRMGFNNLGVDAMVKRIQRSHFEGILGINIGKNATTPVDNSLADYCVCLRKIYPLAGYIAVNVSSPNTRGLRALQHGDEFTKLLAGLKEEHQRLQEKYRRHVPLVVKIAPDMADAAVIEIANRLLQFELDGIIVTNTTLARDEVAGLRHATESGGLSGAPLKSPSNHVLSIVASEVGGKMSIIGVGGIMDGQDALDKINLGADLVQIYTGFIYRGPQLIRDAALALKS